MKDLRTGDVNVPVPERALRQLDEPPVVDDAVYDGGHLVATEHRFPPAELQVRGDHHRLPLVGVGEDLEEEPRAVRVERQSAPCARSMSWMSSDPGAILPPMAFLTRAELGFPRPQTTANGFLWTSMATQMHSFWRDRPRFLACP